MQTGLTVNLDTVWREGIQLRTLKRVSEAETKSLLFKEIADVVNYIDAKKTLDGDGIKGAVDFILEDFWQYTIEEILYTIRSMKKDSDYFERLKYPQIKKKLDAYFNSEERAEKIERHYAKFKERDIEKLEYVDYEAYKKRMKKEDRKLKDNPKQDEIDYNNYKARFFNKEK